MPRALLAALLLLPAACRSSAQPDPYSADPYERYLGAIRLADRRDPVEVRYLERMAADPEPLARDGAVTALGDLGDRSTVAVVAAALKTGEGSLAANTPMVRADACRALARIGGPEAMAALLTALGSDASPEVRRTAAHALAAFPPDRAACRMLAAAIDDPSAGVSRAAWLTLSLLSGRDDLPRERAAWLAWIEALPAGSSP